MDLGEQEHGGPGGEHGAGGQGDVLLQPRDLGLVQLHPPLRARHQKIRPQTRPLLHPSLQTETSLSVVL